MEVDPISILPKSNNKSTVSAEAASSTMSQSSKLIFVTGASGFLASHIIQELITQGYRVRAKNKVGPLKALYESVPVEIVEIADIAHDQFEDALTGVDAVIHTASPLPGREDIESMFKSAVDGSLNVLRQAEKVGVKKFIVTSSIVTALFDPSAKGGAYRLNHWLPFTKENATPENGNMAIYAIAKKYAELAVWEWADAHPHVDVTTINPPYFYGPFAPLHLPIAPGDFNALSTGLMIYSLLSPSGNFPTGAGYADVRDIARAHVGALRPSTVEGRKRIIFSSPHELHFKEVLDAIRKARPEVEGRLIKAPVPDYPFYKFDVDFSLIEKVTGLKAEDFHPVIETLLDTVNAILDLEKSWVDSGFVMPEVIPKMDS
ncbi:Putative uncharacterized oxidoreductase [Psilocybe cubensis]|uniref:NAD-dependent epimerase/dehydratase domain-containing protein n=2 Tax=Psilocybe cubensis TaxID=181762 RepID=A0A8H7Y6S3_PSICU|nr:Putative uncharacterized oxidoreductase [Psilocybe cubensis]KAH9484971.1 Putative uncharacterized oxidoreductase [Psilocybe cubensis]